MHKKTADHNSEWRVHFSFRFQTWTDEVKGGTQIHISCSLQAA